MNKPQVDFHTDVNVFRGRCRRALLNAHKIDEAKLLDRYLEKIEKVEVGHLTAIRYYVDLVGGPKLVEPVKKPPQPARHRRLAPVNGPAPIRGPRLAGKNTR